MYTYGLGQNGSEGYVAFLDWMVHVHQQLKMSAPTLFHAAYIFAHVSSYDQLCERVGN